MVVGAGGGRKAEKQRTVAESFSAPRLASATARRYGISVQLLFAWRKAHCEGRLGAVPVSGVVPAIITPVPAETGTAAAGGRMEVASANGRRVVVDGDVDVGNRPVRAAVRLHSCAKRRCSGCVRKEAVVSRRTVPPLCAEHGL